MKIVIHLVLLSMIIAYTGYGMLSTKIVNEHENKMSDTLSILNKDSILQVLDASLESPYSDFINFDAAYCEFANGRLSLFRSDNKWALVYEKLGFDFRSGDPILFEIYYFGNCLENLEVQNGYTSNYRMFGVENNIYPPDPDPALTERISRIHEKRIQIPLILKSASLYSPDLLIRH